MATSTNIGIILIVLPLAVVGLLEKGCDNSSIFLEPSSCSSYYYCDQTGHLQLATCQHGHLWNKELGECDAEQNVNCENGVWSSLKEGTSYILDFLFQLANTNNDDTKEVEHEDTAVQERFGEISRYSGEIGKDQRPNQVKTRKIKKKLVRKPFLQEEGSASDKNGQVDQADRRVYNKVSVVTEVSVVTSKAFRQLFLQRSETNQHQHQPGATREGGGGGVPSRGSPLVHTQTQHTQGSLPWIVSQWVPSPSASATQS